MKKLNALLIVTAMIAVFASCTSVKNIPYLKNVEEIDLTASRMLYDAKIMPKDQLTIYINTTDPAASQSHPASAAVYRTLESTSAVHRGES